MNQTAILSAEACELLKLLTVNVVSDVVVIRPEPLSQKQILTEYNDVSEGLGELPGEYYIELDATVKPGQHLPRRVPQALKEDICSKIKLGVLTKVTDPSEWISNMVAVKKGENFSSVSIRLISIKRSNVRSTDGRWHFAENRLSESIYRSRCEGRLLER